MDHTTQPTKGDIIYQNGLWKVFKDGLWVPLEFIRQRAGERKISDLSEAEAYALGIYNIWYNVKEMPGLWKNQFYYFTEMENAVKAGLLFE